MAEISICVSFEYGVQLISTVPNLVGLGHYPVIGSANDFPLNSS